MPPGPPVLQSVVAEVHGPSPEVRRQVARDLTDIFRQAESLADVDNYMRDPYEYWRFRVDTEKAVRRGISVDAINRNLSMALGSATLGDVKQRAGYEPINIVIQVPLAERSQVTRLGDLPILSQAGITVPLRELGEFERVREDDIIYRKDLRDIEYVVADVTGRLAAPVYGMFQVQDLLEAKNYVAPDGVAPESYWIGPPKDDRVSAFEWTGEWTVTYETFRDMGAAFAVALVLIYVLVVWEFGNFRIPALIMAPIPLTLLGIIPMHAIMGAEFTATSMIGWIALAGIIVRNSILLVDFSIHEVQRGVDVKEAVIRSCKTRTRPIMITALALVAGSSVIFTDPIFQGMAISLASGVMVSTILTLVVIPLGCINAERALCEVANVACGQTAAAGGTPSAGGAAPVSSGSAGPRTSLAMQVWGKFAGALMMVFYALRGIAMLVGQMFRRKPKPAPRATAPAPTPVMPPEPAAAAPATQPDVATTAPAEVEVEQVSAAEVYGAEEAPAAESPRPAKPVVVGARSTATQKKKQADRDQGAEREPAAVNSSPPAQVGRGKGAGRRGIRLKLIQPGETDTGLK
jgi:hypothetical protein